MVFRHLFQDLRYTFRTLRRDAGFAVFAILIAGLGIGASATVFSVVNTLLLRPLPFAEARPSWCGLPTATPPASRARRRRSATCWICGSTTQTLSAVAGYFAFYGVGDNLLSGRGEPERLSGVPVSDNFFDVLGVKPVLGRTFTAEECTWNGPKAVMLGYALWERRFDSRSRRSSARRSSSTTRPYTVVGVLPRVVRLRDGLRAGQPLRPLLPVPAQPRDQSLGQHDGDDRPAEAGRDRRRRRRPKSRDARARSMTPRASRAQRLRGQRQAAGRAGQRHACGSPSVVLAGAVGVVMLIVCANLSNLLLARTAARQKEIAIRTALGAGRRRLLAPDADRRHRALVQRRGARSRAGDRRHARAGAARCGQHPAAARRAHRRDRARLHPRRSRSSPASSSASRRRCSASGAGMHDALKDASRGSTEGRDGPGCATRWSCPRSRSPACCWSAPAC